MKDSADREINLGDEVAFTVGTAIRTGIVERIRTKKITEEWSCDVAKVRLVPPEPRPDKVEYVLDEQGEYTYKVNERGYEQCVTRLVPQEPKRYRDVHGSERIILLKSLEG